MESGRDPVIGRRPGQHIAGPALIAEHTTTVMVGPGDRLEVDGANNFMIHLGDA